MKIFIRFLSVLLALQGLSAAWLLNPPRAQASGVPDVIINEVMWMGSTASSGSEDEWVELFNPSNEDAVDLSGWTIKNVRTAGAGSDFTFPANTEIAAGDYLLIGQSGLASTILSVPLDIEITSFSLSNPPSCRVLELVNVLSETVDSMGCNGDGTYFAGESTAIKRSLERNVVTSDGAVAGSWHSSVGFKNLDPSASPDNFATPKFVNDTTEPDFSGAIVNDGVAVDLDWSDDTGKMTCNWSGIVDPESGLLTYYVGIGSTTASPDLVGWQKALISESSKELNFPFEVTSGKYYCLVKAANNVGLESGIKPSDGFTIDTIAPNPASNLTVSDVAGDNGGAVFADWDASTSVDEITYRVDYQKIGEVTMLSQNAGINTELTISGLENSPASYQFTVVAIDFSSLESTGNPSTTGTALDNLAPILDQAKVSVTQNHPGTADMIAASNGASSEPATVMVFDRDPANPFSTTLASVPTTSGLGFGPVSIGDNLYGSVWVQLIDAAGNTSVAKEFANDIVGPQTAVITRAVATCLSNRCNVELNWQGDNADTAYYQIQYRVGTAVQTSLPVTKNNLTLNLPASGKLTHFSVYGFDQYGNRSSQSNVFSASLVPGVITTGVLVNGKLIISTKSVAASRETITSSPGNSTVKIVPPAQAAEEPVVTSSDDVKVASDQDWLRIVIVIILLLIVAGGFYSLSRSVQKSNLDLPDEPIEQKTNSSKKKKGKNKSSSRRRRR